LSGAPCHAPPGRPAAPLLAAVVSRAPAACRHRLFMACARLDRQHLWHRPSKARTP
jgi:hypothetical protein